MDRRKHGRIWLRAVVAMAITGSATVSLAQRIVINGNQVIQLNIDGPVAGQPAIGDTVFVPVERTVLQRLSNAHLLLQEARYDEAVRLLGSILDGNEDYFFQADRGSATHRSLKAEAQRLIGSMPPEGRVLYEMQYGARARQMLTQAVAAGDRDALAEVGRQFFHTQAGYESTLLLGLDHLDHARPLAGALALDRLENAPDVADFEPTLSFALATCWLQAGMPDEAREVLGMLRAKFGNRSIEVAGKPVPWFEDETGAIAWLGKLVGDAGEGRLGNPDSWAMFGGDPSRSVVATGGVPLLNARWRVASADEPATTVALQRQRDDKINDGSSAVTALHPLAVGDVVLMRTASNLLAVDFSSGKRLWDVVVADPLTAFSGARSPASPASNAQQTAAILGQRMWDDSTYGILSSDGKRVFAVEDTSLPTVNGSTGRTVILNGRALQQGGQASVNRLAAYDIATGKLRWHLGGPTGHDALPLAGTFFLGAPLPLAGRLYVLGEAKGEIRLFALEGNSGEVAWSQQLAMVEADIMQEAPRRLAGSSPSYADGVLVCPTCSGAVVAVELATRSLLWGYCYERNSAIRNTTQIIVQASGQYVISRSPIRPNSGAAILADGCVLVAPVDSDSLHCLNLIDGEPNWTFRCNNDESVACVHGGNVVLVGRQRVRAISLSETNRQTVRVAAGRGGGVRINAAVQNGNEQIEMTEQVLVTPKLGWDNRSVSLPKGSIVTGQGFRDGDWYYLPLSSTELAVIDVAEGRLLQVVESRSGSVPGNLICHRGKVISQGVDALEVFSQLDAVHGEIDQRLAADSNDPVGLTLQGELLLEDGDFSEAVAVLQRAYQINPAPTTRTLLRDGFLEGLRTDFAAFGGRAEQIEDLLDEPWQQEAFLRLMAIGLREAGEWDAALDYYLKLVDTDSGELRMLSVSKDLAVRMDCWLRPQLAALFREAQGNAASLDRLVESRLQTALRAEGTVALERFLSYFGDQPAAEKARNELVRRFEDTGRWLEAEMLLWPELDSDDPVTVAATVAQLATLYRRAHASKAHEWCQARLNGEFADVVCSEGKTGKEFCDAFADDPLVHFAFNDKPIWPVGKVEQVKSSLSSSSSNSRRGLPYRGSPGPFFADVDFQFDTSRSSLVARDTLGRERWTLLLRPPGTSRNVSYNSSTAHVRVCGHLLLVSLGQGVMAVDTLGRSDDNEPRLLWSQNSDGSGGSLIADSQQVQVIAIAGGALGGFGGGGVIMLDDLSMISGSGGIIESGPLAAGYTCIQRDRDLIALNPTTGEPLWVRRGMMPGNVLFGDDEVVVSTPNGSNEAQILRASDGGLLATRTIPRIRMDSYRSSGVVNVSQSFNRNTAIATFGRRMLVTDYENTGSAFVKVFDPWENRTVWTSPMFTRNAKYEVVGEEAFAIREPDGRFAMFDLADGRTIADVQLKNEANRYCLSVVPWEDGYLVLDVDEYPNSTNTLNVQVLSGTLALPFGKGRVYALDGKGKLAWPEPVEIKNQYFVLDQPRGLPLLTFASRMRDTTSGNSSYQVAVQCVDKRNGRLVCDEQIQYRSSDFNMVADPEKQTVNIEASRERITLTLTDQPLPPPGTPATADTLPEQLENVTRGLLGVFERAIENGPAQEGEDAERRLKEREIQEQRMLQQHQQELIIEQIRRTQQQQPNRPVPEPVPPPAQPQRGQTQQATQARSTAQAAESGPLVSPMPRIR